MANCFCVKPFSRRALIKSLMYWGRAVFIIAIFYRLYHKFRIIFYFWAMLLKETTPTKGNILIKLPNFQKERIRQSESGIYIPHLEGRFEHDVTHGTVISLGEWVEHCQIGDEVFFSPLCIQAGQQNMGTDKTQTDTTKKRSNGVPVYYLADEEGHYLFMPEKRMFLMAYDTAGGQEQECDIHGGVICLIRDEELICLNSYHIMKDAYDAGEVKDGVRTKKVGIIDVVVFGEEDEKKKRFEITHAPADSTVKVGDTVFTRPHCDLKIEGDFNYNLLPKGSYYVIGSNILATVNLEAHAL